MTKPTLVYGPMFGSPERHASVRCPKCGEVGWIDREQFMGRVSIVCARAGVAKGDPQRPGCGYHETHDMRTP